MPGCISSTSRRSTAARALLVWLKVMLGAVVVSRLKVMLGAVVVSRLKVMLGAVVGSRSRPSHNWSSRAGVGRRA